MTGTVAPLEAFDYTATGILGEKRDTMLENQLLLRCQLSQPMKRGYTDYPGRSFCYGRPNPPKEGGAAEALSGWPSGGLYFHRKREGSQDTRPERDFMALNRSAVQAGLTSSREYSQFRSTHDIRRKIPTEKDEKKTGRRIPPDMVFGIATRPATPIHDLLEHRYQDRWVNERRSVELSKRKKDQSNVKKLIPGKVTDTRASILRSYQVPVELEPLWHMPKFAARAAPHLETFRSGRAREQAYSHYKSDRVGRQGISGHGMYEPAKN